MRWTHDELAAQVQRDGLLDSIHPATIGRILSEADCQPHRVQYWLRSQDPLFLPKATRVLWYYERAESLWRDGVAVVCLDEKPNIQALGRRLPDIAAAPGRVRRREFEYKRHGTVNLLLALVVATGEVWGCVLDRNDSDHFLAALAELTKHLADARRIEIVLDNASSHVSRQTRAAIAADDRVRFHHTPTHASWLNQAEIGLGAIHRRYLKGAIVASREEMIKRAMSGIADYNERHAKPIDWSFTRHAMKDWHINCQPTSAGEH